jgi:hypothetical protein
MLVAIRFIHYEMLNKTVYPARSIIFSSNVGIISERPLIRWMGHLVTKTTDKYDWIVRWLLPAWIWILPFRLLSQFVIQGAVRLKPPHVFGV